MIFYNSCDYDSSNLNSSKNKQNFEQFNNVQNSMSSLDDPIDDNKNIPTTKSNATDKNIPTTKSNATDKNYQCSDEYNMIGSTLNEDYNGFTLDDCKNNCMASGLNCVGFNYDNSNKICTLKKDASSIANSSQSSTFCIKKSARTIDCESNNIKAFNDLDSIFNSKSEQIPTTQKKTEYPMDIPTINIEQNKVSSEDNLFNGNNSQEIYVDLDCFMKNFNSLKVHSDNMMIELSLLLSNIKNCSYTKKTSEKIDDSQLTNQITSKINVQELTQTAQTAQTAQSTQNILKEPFVSDSEKKSYSFNYQDLILVIILFILICLLVFRK